MEFLSQTFTIHRNAGKMEGYISLTSLCYSTCFTDTLGISWGINELGTGLDFLTASANHYATWYVQGAQQKKHWKENPWIHVNLIKIKSILYFLIVVLAYMQGALWKKRLTDSFVEHFIASFVEHLIVKPWKQYKHYFSVSCY